MAEQPQTIEAEHAGSVPHLFGRAADLDGSAAGAVLTIDLQALVANWRLLAAKAMPAECAAVVKADAYGTGQEQAVRALAAAGCRTFFVAHVAEAVRVRAAAPADTVVYVLNGLAPNAEDRYRAHRLRPVLGSLPEVARWATLTAGTGGIEPAALHVDTGMNRLGLAPGEAQHLLGAPGPRPFPVGLIMSHFVSAEVPNDPVNDRQIEAFEAFRHMLPTAPASLANSSGIFLGSRAHHDIVRPGYALYGGNPTPGTGNPMQPVVRLDAQVILCRTAEAGATVGYNGVWTSEGPSRLATIAVGYADGYPRAASGTNAEPGGAAIVAGRRCPFVGRISMDLIVVDVSHVPEAECRAGDRVELIGPRITVDDVGRFAKTSGYEILTNLGHRYRRVYLA